MDLIPHDGDRQVAPDPGSTDGHGTTPEGEDIDALYRKYAWFTRAGYALLVAATVTTAWATAWFADDTPAREGLAGGLRRAGICVAVWAALAVFSTIWRQEVIKDGWPRHGPNHERAR